MTYTMTVSQKINHKSHPSITSAKIRNLTATSGPSANCDFRPLSQNKCSWFPTDCCANLHGCIYLQGTCLFASQLPIQQQYVRQSKHTNNCMTIRLSAAHEPHVMQHYKYILTYDRGRDKGPFNLHFMALKQVLPLLLQPHKLICTIIHTKFHENLSNGLTFKKTESLLVLLLGKESRQKKIFLICSG
jgi:hypothetical protein